MEYKWFIAHIHLDLYRSKKLGDILSIYILKSIKFSFSWWFQPVIPAPGRLSEAKDGCENKIRLNYLWSPRPALVSDK